jgi:hypothetical protein
MSNRTKSAQARFGSVHHPPGLRAVGIGAVVLFSATLAVAVAPAVAAPSTTPVVSALSSHTGPTSGGERIIVRGSHFTRTTRVHFGASSGARVHVSSSHSLSVTVPRHAAGTVDVRVTTGNGTSARARTDHFGYIARPTVRTISPHSAYTTGGSVITIHGSNFVGATRVLFGRVSTSRVRVLSSTSLRVTAPAHSAGPVVVRVVTHYGSSRSFGRVTYVRRYVPPVISTTALPTAGIGQPYIATLQVADHRPGTWSVTGTLPAGLLLSTNTIVGKPTAVGASTFTLNFTDATAHTVHATATLTVSTNVVTGGGAIENLGYCRNNAVVANDDTPTDAIALPFAMNFLGTSYSSTYVSNNGYVTFAAPDSTYTPYDMSTATAPVIAPYFADVDTRPTNSPLVTYGSSPDGTVFCVDWIGVGYFNQHTDKVVNFQLLITKGAANGDFGLTFNYGSMQWETGDASGGIGGLGGQSAVVGYASGAQTTGTYAELLGSGVNGALIDGGPDSLASGSNTGVTGRYAFSITN